VGISRERVLLRMRYGWPQGTVEFDRNKIHQPDGYRCDEGGYVSMCWDIPTYLPGNFGGMSTLTLDTLPGEPLEIPYARVNGRAGEGPRLTVVAGVHGTEYTGMAALMRLIGQLDPARLSGTLTVVPVLNQLAFWSRTPFVVPADGQNLNRAFPGDPAGSYTDVLAHELFEAFIRPSDVLLDLHAGDLPEALEPFCLYEESPVEARARELALVYGTGHVVRWQARWRQQGSALRGQA